MLPDNLNVVVVVPSGTHWLAEFGTSLISMLGYFSNNRIGASRVHSYRVVNIKGSILPTLRLRGLIAAKEADATHLLYLDSDHTFPPDMLNRLLRHGKDCVAVNCVTKSLPAMTTARRFNPDDPQGDPVFSDPESSGLERVWRVGTGVMLIAKRTFLQIPHDSFTMPYMPSRGVYQGEDWTLCEAIEKIGSPIYIDHEVSQEVGHIGTLTYTHDYVGTIVREPVE
jgi:hypothetical protein